MSKIIKISLITLAIILGSSLALWGFMQTSVFQNYLAKRISSYLSKELHTTVNIAGLEVRYFDHLLLKDVLVLDLEQDTMFHIGRLDANYDLWSWSNKIIRFDKVLLEDADVRLGILQDDKALNLQFIISYFTPDTFSSNASSPALRFDKLLLRNCTFNYFDRNLPRPESRAFNENDFTFQSITGTLTDFEIINDSLVFDLEGLSATESSGLTIKSFDAKCIISSTLMEFRDLNLKTGQSEIKDYLAFKYNSYQDFADFIEVIEIDADLNGSKIHSKDLEYFSNELSPYNDLIAINGHITGTVNNMRGENLNFSMGKSTQFIGAARIKGIPDMMNSYWDLHANTFSTNAEELGKYVQLSEIPSELHALGKIEFEGQFQGFLKEFVCYGNLKTSIGEASTDIKFGVNPDGKEAYSGRLESKSINLAPLLNYPNAGRTGFDLSISGEGLAIESLSADIEGVINYIEFNAYRYRNIKLDGTIKEDLYTGFASINDKNLDLNFDGIINASLANPTIDVTAHARLINLKTLGLDTEDSYLKFDGEINLEDKDDDIYGIVYLDSINLERSGKHYPLKSVNLIASAKNDFSDKQILLQSDLVNMQLKGEYTLLDLPEIAESILYFLLPHDDDETKPEFADSRIALKAGFSTFHPILKEYLKDFNFSNAYIDLEFDSKAETLHTTGNINGLNYSNFSSDSLLYNFDRNNNSEPLNAQIKAYQIAQNDSFLLSYIEFEGMSLGRRLDFLLSAGRDDLDAELNAYLIQKSDSTEIYINSLDANINNKIWHMEETEFANVVYHQDLLELLYIDLRNQDEIMFIDATFGQGNQKVSLVLDNFLLDNINPFIAGSGLSLGGKANGFVDIKYVEGFPIFESDLHIQDIAYDKDTLGDFYLQSISGANPLEIVVTGQLEKGLVDKLLISGNVDFEDPANALNISLRTDRSSISALGYYLNGLASDVEGYITADLKVEGPIDLPQLSGKAYLDDLKFKVDYLQTVYSSTAEIEVGNNFFKFTKATIKDRFGKKGIVSGSINHANYRNFLFDIEIKDLENFECMNTSRKDNELFYGSAYADGKMQIKGPLEDILLVIQAKSRKGTKIFIPLDNIATDGQLTYVQFADFKADENQIKELVKTSDGVRMEFNFEITNDADVELIFDELLGDKIKGNGHGNLRMEINTYGDFNMYGQITIDRGNYLFTAFNFINKYFTVTPGGTLSWDGDPYNAKIDLVATKREYPQPSTLLAGMVSQEELEQNYSEAIPVDCELKLTGLLFNPNISFNLSFPSSNSLSSSQTSTFYTVVERVRQDQEELDRQVFALIALGTFIPPSFSDAGGVYSAGTGFQNSVNNSISDFVSSQLTNWLSQIDPKWQVGVDYQGATESAKAELVLSIKRKILNDRLELQGSYDAGSASGSSLYDVNVQYNLSDDGTFKLRGFHRNANDPSLGNISNVTTSGVGLFYRHQFDYFWFNKPQEKDSTSP